MPTYSGSVVSSPVNDYCTVAEIKAMMQDNTWGATYDAILAILATRASRALDRFVGRANGAFYVTVDSTKYFDGSGGREQWIDELAATPTSVAVAETGALTTYTTWAATDYILWPYSSTPYLRLDV